VSYLKKMFENLYKIRCIYLCIQCVNKYCILLDVYLTFASIDTHYELTMKKSMKPMITNLEHLYLKKAFKNRTTQT